MHENNHQSLYRKAVNECRFEIQNGTLEAGCAFYSRAELCRKFSISLVTAHKVQRELAQQGQIIPQAGGRFIVSRKIKIQAYNSSELSKVRIIGAPQAIDSDTYGGIIVEGIRSACEKRGLEFAVEFVDVLNQAPGYINANRRLEAGEGLVAMVHEAMAQEIAPIIMNPTVRVVTVNSYFPYRPAVLPDYRTGIHEQFSEAVSRGARKVLYCDRLDYVLTPLISTMREELIKAECDRLGVELALETSGNYRHIAETIRQYKPDVVFFMNDLSAIHFKQVFAGKKRKIPRIIGCDNYGPEPELSELSTWDTNPYGMGEACVEVLCDPDALTRPYTRFVPGKLIIRD